MRLFFAIELGQVTKQAVADAIDAIGIHNPPWRWVATSNFHLTMKFLGEMSEGEVPRLVAAAEAACKDVGSFDLGFGRLGAFPDLKKPRVIFYEATGATDTMKTLAARLDRALAARVGTQEERRPFRAHLTVARVKTPVPPAITKLLERAPAPDASAEIITKLSLMQSHLSPKGAQYQCLKEIAL